MPRYTTAHSGPRDDRRAPAQTPLLLAVVLLTVLPGAVAAGALDRAAREGQRLVCFERLGDAVIVRVAVGGVEPTRATSVAEPPRTVSSARRGGAWSPRRAAGEGRVSLPPPARA